MAVFKLCAPGFPTYIDPQTLVLTQQCALLTMRETHLSRGCAAKLRAKGHTPNVLDYQALVDLGLAERLPRNKWHSLTPRGETTALSLETRLSILFGLRTYMRPRRLASGFSEAGNA